MENTAVDQNEEKLRFRYGENWRSFLKVLTDKRIQQAENSLKEMLEVDTLEGKSFLDIGCGSGLFSLVARRLGASVHSFDYDPDSVACAQTLRDTHFPGDAKWFIEQGSVLDEAFIRKFTGQFDVVYSWGVLMTTGAMWRAIENALIPVARNGRLFIAIYNDQGKISERWLKVKRLYGHLPEPGKFLLCLGFGAFWTLRYGVKQLVKLRNPLPFKSWAETTKSRGMSYWHDIVDWIGGYPFEVAKPEQIFEFVHRRNFTLEKLKTVGGGHANNEFVFKRTN